MDRRWHDFSVRAEAGRRRGARRRPLLRPARMRGGMRLSEVPVVDVRGALTAQRDRLLSLLTSLTEAQWGAATAAPEWSVQGHRPAPARCGPELARP